MLVYLGEGGHQESRQADCVKVISFVHKCVESKTNHKAASRHLPPLTSRIQDAKFESGRKMKALQCKNSPGVDK